MFLTPMSSGMTRWSICPSVSRVASTSPRPWSRERPPLEKLQPVTQLERVEVRDDDSCLLKVREHVAGHQLAALVIAVRIVGLKNPQAVFDRDAGRHHQKTTREPAALRVANRIDGLPRDQQSP